MNPDLAKFLGDKIVPLFLIAGAGLAYKLGLPNDYCVGISSAGFLAFQITKASPANPPQA